MISIILPYPPNQILHFHSVLLLLLWSRDSYFGHSANSIIWYQNYPSKDHFYEAMEDKKGCYLTAVKLSNMSFFVATQLLTSRCNVMFRTNQLGAWKQVLVADKQSSLLCIWIFWHYPDITFIITWPKMNVRSGPKIGGENVCKIIISYCDALVLIPIS